MFLQPSGLPKGRSTMADRPDQNTDISRRDFVTFSAAAGLAAPGRLHLGGGQSPDRRDQRRGQDPRRHLRRRVHSSDHRYSSRRADLAGCFWAASDDARIGKRMAAEGYSVLVPNPFYRTRRRPSSIRRSSTSRTRRHGEAAAADGRGQRARAAEKDAAATSRFSTRSRRSTRRRRSARRATAWADRSW